MNIGEFPISVSHYDKFLTLKRALKTVEKPTSFSDELTEFNCAPVPNLGYKICFQVFDIDEFRNVFRDSCRFFPEIPEAPGKTSICIGPIV